MKFLPLTVLLFSIGFHTSGFSQRSCLLDEQWTTPAPTVITYEYGGGWIAGVPDPSNLVAFNDTKGVFEGYFSANPGVEAVGSVRASLGSLDDANDNLRFRVVIYDDNGFGEPGALIGQSNLISPTALGVPGEGFYGNYLIDLPTNPIPVTAFFLAGVEITAGDEDDVLVVMTSCLGPAGCAVAEGEGDGSNAIVTSIFGYENLLTTYGADFDVAVIPRLVGPDSSFTYPDDVYYTNEAADPIATLTGETGGVFTASPAGLAIDPSTGEVDLSASTVGDYIITYTASTNCTNSSDLSITIEAATNIGDFIWNDLNANGLQDGGEPGLPGVTVYLDMNSNGALDDGEPTDTTDSEGAYDFIALAANTYSVQVDASTLSGGYVLTTDNLPMAVILAAGDDFNDADFGYQQQDASIGDFIWNDLNANGLQDGGEPGLSGVTVYLDLNSNGVLDDGEPTDTTDSEGAYDFIGLAANTYSVQVDAATPSSGFVLTTGNLPMSVTLAAGDDFNDADFGYQQLEDIFHDGFETAVP